MYGLAFITGEHFRSQRRFALHVLRDFGFGRNQMEAKINDDIDRLLAHWETRCRDGRFQLNPTMNLSVCLASIISNIAIGERYSYENDAQFAHLQKTNSEFFEVFLRFSTTMLNAYPWLRYVPLFEHFGLDEMARCNAQFETYFMPLIDKWRRRVDDEPIDTGDEPDNFTHAYLREIRRRRLAGEKDDGFE